MTAATEAGSRAWLASLSARTTAARLAKQATMSALSLTRVSDSSRARRSVPSASWRQHLCQTWTSAIRPAVHQAASGPRDGAPVKVNATPTRTPIPAMTSARRVESIRSFIVVPS